MQRLHAIEAMRALSAVSIVLFHARSVFQAQFPQSDARFVDLIGDRGVDIFFVMTGFVTFLGAMRGQPGAGDWGGFVLRRIVRIFPLLWVVVLSFYGLKAVLFQAVFEWQVIAISLVPIPILQEPSPVIVWTLRHVLMFYVFFAVLLASRRAGVALGAVWVAACLVQTVLAVAGAPLSGVAAMVASPFNLQFFLGGIAAWAWLRAPGPRLWPLVPALGIALAFLAADRVLGGHRQGILDYGSVEATVWVIAAGVAFAAATYALARADRLVATPGVLLRLGAASYAIYLVHAPAMGVIAKLIAWGAPDLAPAAIGVAMVAGALVAGVAAHHMVEVPVTRWLGRRLGVR